MVRKKLNLTRVIINRKLLELLNYEKLEENIFRNGIPEYIIYIYIFFFDKNNF